MAVSVEMRAVNRITTLHPDAAKRRAAARAVRAGGLPALRSPLACPSLVALVRRTGVPAQLSIDAGDYVCNQTLYAGSRACGTSRTTTMMRPRRSRCLR